MEHGMLRVMARWSPSSEIPVVNRFLVSGGFVGAARLLEVGEIDSLVGEVVEKCMDDVAVQVSGLAGEDGPGNDSVSAAFAAAGDLRTIVSCSADTAVQDDQANHRSCSRESLLAVVRLARVDVGRDSGSVMMSERCQTGGC